VAFALKMIEEGQDQGRVEIRQHKAFGCLAHVLLGKLEEQAKAITVGGHGLWTRVPLSDQPLQKIFLQERGKTGGLTWKPSGRCRTRRARIPSLNGSFGTIRRECLDRTLFRTATDLELKLLEFQRYYHGHRAHAGLKGRMPDPSPAAGGARASVGSYRWAAALSRALSDADGGVRVCVRRKGQATSKVAMCVDRSSGAVCSVPE
jgi:hypothetical protein